MNRHYFLGGNTPLGFHSYFDSLLGQREANKIYVIKGGPGTGKSTLMKKAAQWAEEHGYHTDCLHCSSDPDSLDGMVIPELGVGMVDGTSPHIVDPKNPACVDTIIHLGDFWDEAAIRRHKEEILQYNTEIQGYYARAYRYLRTAGDFYSAIGEINRECLDEAYIRESAAELTQGLEPNGSGTGRIRKLFLTAISPYGVVGFPETFTYANIRVLNGSICGGGSRVLKRAAAVFIENGYDIECFYDPLMPADSIAHLVVPALELFITTNDVLVQFPNAEKTIDLDGMLYAKALERHKEELAEYKELIGTMLDQAVAVMKRAKSTHDLLEGCYVPYMDFKKINGVHKRVIKDMEQFAD